MRGGDGGSASASASAGRPAATVADAPRLLCGMMLPPPPSSHSPCRPSPSVHGEVFRSYAKVVIQGSDCERRRSRDLRSRDISPAARCAGSSERCAAGQRRAGRSSNQSGPRVRGRGGSVLGCETGVHINGGELRHVSEGNTGAKSTPPVVNLEVRAERGSFRSGARVSSPSATLVWVRRDLFEKGESSRPRTASRREEGDYRRRRSSPSLRISGAWPRVVPRSLRW